LSRFEDFTSHADFRAFNQKTAVGFKAYMVRRDLAPATILSTVKQVMRFFRWLSIQPGYRSKIRSDDIDFMNLSEKATRSASAPRDRDYPTVAMIEVAIDLMPEETAVEKRNRALMALSALTAIRVNAMTTLKLKHFDRRRRLIIQMPDEVETKFSKRIDTFLMPVSERFEVIFLDWIEYLEREELFGPRDPMFPQNSIGQDVNRQFKTVGLSRSHWRQSGSARRIIKGAFEKAGLPPFGPHSFRNMLVSEMYRRGVSVAVLKAGSQNLGHESMLTTLTSYGKISLEEQGRLIREAFAHPGTDQDEDSPETVADLKAILTRKGII
jgi:integrase